jgi:hypothetical protein
MGGQQLRHGTPLQKAVKYIPQKNKPDCPYGHPVWYRALPCSSLKHEMKKDE